LKSTSKTKIKPKEMRLIVDSGSTKADWIAIDEDGKVLFTKLLD
jgi:N-acetylglucosamine kinase-like BadF-type ATPase